LRLGVKKKADTIMSILKLFWTRPAVGAENSCQPSSGLGKVGF
jgi:hypothetical protein